MKESKHYTMNNKLGHRNFCSQTCQSEGKRKGHESYCVSCGIKIYVSPHRQRNSKSGFCYCSKTCASKINNALKVGLRNSNYTNGAASYRNQALRVLDAKCNICGYNIIEVLEIHHIDGNRANNDIDNLEVLCPTHHKEYTLGVRS